LRVPVFFLKSLSKYADKPSMKKRPIQIQVLAALQFLSPLVNILSGAIKYRVTPMFVIHTVWFHLGWTDRFQFFFLGPVLGMVIYVVKKWSIPIAVGCISLLVTENFVGWYTHPKGSSLGSAIFTSLLNLLVVMYLLLPQVRIAYINRRVRWWESKPRYVITTSCDLIHNGNKFSASVLNISEGGLFLTTGISMNQGDSVTVEPGWKGNLTPIAAKILHRSLVSGVSGYGIQFLHTRETHLQTKVYLKELKAQNVPCSIEKTNLPHEVKELATSLVHGKGWIPEVPERYRPKRDKT
jgi:hypothetical protein